MDNIAKTPNPPYYCVIFTYQKTNDDDGYKEMEEKTVNMVSKQKGFLGMEQSTNTNGFGVLISYWDSIESINIWKTNMDHVAAKNIGRKQWYSKYMTRICKVESDKFFYSN